MMLRTRLISMTAAAAALAVAPATASADAAHAALGTLIVHVDGYGVPDGRGSMNVVVACSAIGVAPATATRVQCSAGPARAGATLPGSTVAAAGTGTGASGPFTICVSATTYPIAGPSVSASSCRQSVGSIGSITLD